MQKPEQNYLILNGETLPYLTVDGANWIPINPLCQALQVKASDQVQRVKYDLIMAPEHRTFGVQVGSQKRNMVCLPEMYIYGFIMSITVHGNMSEDTKENLTQYKKECYKVLYTHFHGRLAAQTDILRAKARNLHRMDELEKELLEDERYQEWQSCQKRQKALDYALRKTNTEHIHHQLLLFESPTLNGY